MSVLMIAPTRSDLPNVAIEAAAVVNALGGTLVQGPVTERDVRDAASAGGFEGIWFATHAGIVEGKTRVLLTDESLSEESVVAYVAASGASWCFLNTCASNVLGLRILDETLADVICTVSELPDPAAMRTGVLFARQLALLGDPWSAYQRSKPGGNRQYNFLVNYRQREMAGINGGNTYPAAQDRLQASMDQMSRDMSKISTDVEVLKERTTSIDSRLAKIENTVRPSAALPTWMLLTIGLIISMLVIFLLFRSGV
jgi:hypothetical protein